MVFIRAVYNRSLKKRRRRRGEREREVNQSHPEVPRGFQEVKVPSLCNNSPEWW